MVDAIREISPLLPPGPLSTHEEVVSAIHTLTDKALSMQQFINNEILPSLRKREEEHDVRCTQHIAITAATTQAQGEGALTGRFVEVTVCANANDVVTLPAATDGCASLMLIENLGAETLQIFPASGDSINAGAVDASATLATSGTAILWSKNATNWRMWTV